jgi:hypothetical protein
MGMHKGTHRQSEQTGQLPGVFCEDGCHDVMYDILRKIHRGSGSYCSLREGQTI